jgi:hypothetical protein
MWHDRVDHAVSSLRVCPMSGDPSSVCGLNALSLWAENGCVASTLRSTWGHSIGKGRFLLLTVLLSLQRRSETLHESKVLGNLCFKFRNGDTTAHMFLQKFVIALF